jgi:RNA polymerase sigma-70 factor (ECF subfamily)
MLPRGPIDEHIACSPKNEQRSTVIRFVTVSDARPPTTDAGGRESVDTAFGHFYTTSFGELARYAGRLVGDVNIGDELAQEAMVRVYARWPLLSTPRPYAFRAVHNLATDHGRRRRREQDALRATRPAEGRPDPDLSIRDAVDRLPERLRSVVVLHYFADLPLNEIATILRRPVGTVGRRLHEARAALLGMIEEPS